MCVCIKEGRKNNQCFAILCVIPGWEHGQRLDGERDAMGYLILKKKTRIKTAILILIVLNAKIF